MQVKNLIKRNNRGQAYTLESIIAILLLITVILFILPSFTTPAGTSEVDSIKEKRVILQDADEMLQAHVDSGQVKADILNYDDSDGRWDAGPTGFTNQHIVTHPTTPFGEAIASLEERRNVIIDIYLIPSPDDSTAADGPERILFANGGDASREIGTVSTVITLYNDDWLKSPASAHTRRGSGYPQNEGDEKRLEDANNFPIDEADTGVGSNGEVYNTVEVELVIGQETN